MLERCLGQPRHLSAREPACRVVPRLGLGEEALGEPDARLRRGSARRPGRRATGARRSCTRSRPRTLRAGTRSPSAGTRGSRSCSRRRASGVPGERSLTAIPYSVNVSPGPVTMTPSPTRTACDGPAHLRRRSAVAELRLDPTGPRRLVVGELDAAAVARGTGVFERLVVRAALTLDLLERRVWQQRDGDGLVRGRECRRLTALDELPAVAGDRRHRALLLRDNTHVAAEPVGDRSQRRETEPRAHIGAPRPRCP